MLLTISHGQGSVERGYSVNKDMIIENLHVKTVVALRTVHDSISTLEDHFTKLPLTPCNEAPCDVCDNALWPVLR